MRNKLIINVLFCGFVYFVGLAVSIETDVAGHDKVAGSYFSPNAMVLSRDGALLYVAGNGGIIICEGERLDVVRSNKDIQNISGVTVWDEGKKLFVTSGGANGKVLILDADTLALSDEIAVGHTPASPVLSRNGEVLYLCNRFDNRVMAIGLKHKKILWEASDFREPSAIALTEDGRYLFVTNRLTQEVASGGYTGSVVSVIDSSDGKKVRDIRLPDGTGGVKDITFSTDGRYAYVPSVLARYRLPATQLARGWVNTNALNIIDVNTMDFYATVLLDDIDRGAANPWSVAVIDQKICVTTSGTNELIVIDEVKLFEKLKLVPKKKLKNISYDLNFLNDFKIRNQLNMKGARALAVNGGGVYIAGYFSNSLSKYNISKQKILGVRELGDPEMDVVRRGEYLFNDASYCFQSWQSCVSCHIDGRTDGFNWDLPKDGLGSSRNTKSVLYSVDTPPTTITGSRINAHASILAAVKFSEARLPKEDTDALLAYVKSLKPVPSPYLVNGKLSVSAKRGQKIFGSADCKSCHSGAYFTNQKLRDVGTGEGKELGVKYDVPTLREIWRTGPYLHDGRAKTMIEVFTKFNQNESHGETRGFSEKELIDLAEYVLSL